MQYFTNGLDGLIRVDTDAPRGSREFFFAKAEILDADGTWFEQRKLMLEILDSGYFRPATPDEADQIISRVAQPIPTPEDLVPPPVPTFTYVAETVREPALAWTA
jgi:hypothetical protein